MICMKRDCTSPATQLLKFCAPGENDGTTEAMLDLRLCSVHMDEVDPLAFIASSPDILGALGLSKGDSGLVYVEGVPLESMEAKAFLSAAVAKVN